MCGAILIRVVSILFRSDGDYTHGILQSIGFKEFHDFLMLSDEEHLTVADPVRSEKLIEEGVEKLKLVTKRYARRQIKWIRNRFLRSECM